MNQAPDRVGASEFGRKGFGIFTDHGEQEEKLSETRTTLAHLAKPVASSA
jgi:hypothetical protein